MSENIAPEILEFVDTCSYKLPLYAGQLHEIVYSLK